MSYRIAEERFVKHVGAKNNYIMNFDGFLESGENLTGTPTVSEKGTNDLTISNVGINSSDVSKKKPDGGSETVPANKGVQFTVASGGTAGTVYTLTFSVSTDSSPAETWPYGAELEVVADP